MILPSAPATYTPAVETERNRTLTLEDGNNRKVGQDLEVGDEKLILKSPNGTRWSITVSNLGVLSATSL